MYSYKLYTDTGLTNEHTDHRYRSHAHTHAPTRTQRFARQTPRGYIMGYIQLLPPSPLPLPVCHPVPDLPGARSVGSV